MVPHIGAVYDTKTLALRRVIVPEKPQALFDGTHRPMPGEALCTVQKQEVRGMSLIDAGRYAIQKATGRVPPMIGEVHAADSAWRALMGR